MIGRTLLSIISFFVGIGLIIFCREVEIPQILWFFIFITSMSLIWYSLCYLVGSLIDTRDSYLIERGLKVWDGQCVRDPVPGPGEGYQIGEEYDEILGIVSEEELEEAMEELFWSKGYHSE